MTEKEALQAVLDGEKADFVPNLFFGGQLMLSSVLGNLPAIGLREGYDWWGVHWTACEEAGGMFTPTAGRAPVISDICNWREELKLPDISGIDWEAAAARDKANLDPNKLTIFFGMGNGIFERIHFLLGFEETMYALVEDPEEVAALANTIADFYVILIEKIGKYYQPDYLTFLDDYTHKDGAFMSPETFDAIFAGPLKKIVDAVESNGMKYIQHCCGREELLLDNFYRIGIRRIDPWQPCNHTEEMQKKYPDVTFIGGLDTQFVVDVPDVSEETLRNEVIRCYETYGKYGNYVFYPSSVSMYDPRAYAPGGRINIMMDQSMRCAHSKG